MMGSPTKTALLSAMLSSLVLGQTKDVDGWSHARWGMNQQQVLSAFPGAAKILTGDGLNRKWGPRGLAMVGIDRASIGAIPVHVFFFFDGQGKLDGLRLPATSASPSDDQFTKMEDALMGEYGGPTVRGAKGKSSFLSAWVFPNGVIELVYVPKIMLNVVIDKRNKQTAESIMAGFSEVHGRHPLSGLFSQQSAGREPTDASWRAIKSWSGSGIKETESFSVQGRQWRVSWSTRNETFRGSGILQIYVKNGRGNLVSTVSTHGVGGDASYVHSPPGEYYLTINSGNVDWTVVVEEHR
jgi:hypothetical protein